MYIVPRVNPDGVERALADSPEYLRSSTRPWPYSDCHRWGGILPSDIDGDGKILSMRVKDPHGGWIAHPKDPRVMIPVDHIDSPLQTANATSDDATLNFQRYRILCEGLIENYDGFTIPNMNNPRGLDMNRNFPNGWGKDIPGSGDYALSEPEVDALVRAMAARPNICGYNVYHTCGGFLLRSSSTKSDTDLPPLDLWVLQEFGAKGTELTGYPCISIFEDVLFDKSKLIRGAGHDYAYDNMAVFSWTTEFWDVVAAATGHRASLKIWTLGPTVEENLAIAKWADENSSGSYCHWRPFHHPQLGEVELGGPDEFNLIINPPLHLLRKEVAPHAEFAIYQALLSPRLEIVLLTAELIPSEPTAHADGSLLFLWRIKVEKSAAVAQPWLESADGSSALRVTVGQLSGRLATRVEWSGSDGTPDRALCVWVVRSHKGAAVAATAFHERAGRVTSSIALE